MQKAPQHPNDESIIGKYKTDFETYLIVQTVANIPVVYSAFLNKRVQRNAIAPHIQSCIIEKREDFVSGGIEKDEMTGMFHYHKADLATSITLFDTWPITLAYYDVHGEV